MTARGGKQCRRIHHILPDAPSNRILTNLVASGSHAHYPLHLHHSQKKVITAGLHSTVHHTTATQTERLPYYKHTSFWFWNTPSQTATPQMVITNQKYTKTNI
jgi:hypothetical protein